MELTTKLLDLCHALEKVDTKNLAKTVSVDELIVFFEIKEKCKNAAIAACIAETISLGKDKLA